MSYSVCPNCGQKALTVATRCPRCGLAFEEQFFGRTEIAPKPRRIPLTVLIIGAGLALLVGNELVLKLKAPVRQAQPGAPPAPVVIVMPPAPQADSTGARPSLGSLCRGSQQRFAQEDR